MAGCPRAINHCHPGARFATGKVRCGSSEGSRREAKEGGNRNGEMKRRRRRRRGGRQPAR